MKESAATFEEFPLSVTSKWILGLSRLFKRNNVHCFDISDRNSHFFLEKRSDAPGRHYMTAHKGDVEARDLIKIEHHSEIETYIIEDIDFYSNPSDMWIARLRALPNG